MKFFSENFPLKNVICTDLPGPSRQPWFQKGGVISIERPDTKIRIVHYELDDVSVTSKTQEWFTEIHSLLNLHPPKLTYYKNDLGNIVGVDSHYESLELRRKVEDFIFMPFSIFLNFPYTKRFHLRGLPLSGGKEFAPDDTWVRMTVFNDKLAFCLQVNHEGHDYSLTYKHHGDWAIRLMADLGIEGYTIEWEADFFLTSESDFDRIYDFLSLHADENKWF